MYTLPEAITIKFTELFGAVHYATDDLKIAGAEANLIGDFSQVAALNETCRTLQELEAEIKSVLNKFQSKPKNRLTVKASSSKNAVARTRKSGGHLRVRLADEIIEKETIADTFVETIKVFGLEQVANLNKFVVGVPLLGRSPINGYQSQRQIGNWYLTTHVNKQIALRVLDEIGKELNVPIQIEIVKQSPLNGK
jgi:hypothetical protein